MILDDLKNQVAASVAVEESAVTLINGIGQRVQDAVNVALQNGATAEQLAPVQSEVDALKTSAAALAAAIVANTPAAPAAPAAEPVPAVDAAPAATDSAAPTN